MSSVLLTIQRAQRIIDTSPSPVAQLVEQVAVNHRVGGSNPSRGAIISIQLRHHLFYYRALFLKQLDVLLRI